MGRRISALLKKAKRGDIEARKELFSLFLPLFLRYVRHVSKLSGADEAELQGEALLTLLRAVEEFEPSRGVPFEAFVKEKVWEALLSFVRREAKRKRRERLLSDFVGEGLRPPKGLPVSPEEAVLRKVDMEKALEALPEREREVIVGLFYKGLTQGEVARRLGVSQSQVSKLKAKALRRLREFLEEEYF